MTRFDITATGITTNYRDNQVPNQSVADSNDAKAQYLRARNQQRNLDTMLQIISLRCLPEDITVPEQQHHNGRWWCFEFTVPDINALQQTGQDLAYLLMDSEHVPMITALDEDAGIGDTLHTGPSGNTRFEILD